MTSLQIKNAKPGMHADGNGLYLSVNKKEAKSWIFRFQLKDRRREMGLGALHVMTAVDARAKAAELKALVARGVDPLDQRKAERLAAEASTRANEQESERRTRTFRAAAERHIANHEVGWRNPKHRQQWANTLETYANPKIGDMLVDEITTAHEHGYPFEVCEAALAHKIGLKEVAAYLRTDHLKKRTSLMQAWAEYLVPPAPAS